MQLLFQTLHNQHFPSFKSHQVHGGSTDTHTDTQPSGSKWQNIKQERKIGISHATIRINSATHPWKSGDARKNFWHTENLMWKQGLAGRLWESAAAVVNSMPIYCQKKKKKGRRRARFWSLTYCGKCMPFCFSPGRTIT